MIFLELSGRNYDKFPYTVYIMNIVICIPVEVVNLLIHVISRGVYVLESHTGWILVPFQIGIF